jgi:integrase
MRASCSTGTWVQYECALKKWILFCKVKKWNVWEVNPRHYLCFLANLYKSGLGYSSINTTRSALSSVFGKINNCEVGSHKLLNQFMKGVSRLRPPCPKYSITWDASQVLDLLKSWDTDNCSMLELSYKLLSLLALVTGQRVQSLASIRVSNIVWGNCVQIKLTDVLKTTKISNPNPVLVIPPYQNQSICPLYTLKKYLDITAALRQPEKIDALFLSYVTPYKAVTRQTLSRWLCKTLSLANIDINMFSGHSFRHASSSKAASKGINTDSIMQRVGWTPGSDTFAKFYKKPIITRSDYAISILNE